MADPSLCCIAKRQVLPDIAITVVRNGLRYLLPALSSLQPFPSEMFGVRAGCFKLQRPAPSGVGLFFVGFAGRPRASALAPPDARAAGPRTGPGSAPVRAFSMVRRRSLVSTPPSAEKPPLRPPAASTRWHGTMIGQGFWPSATPTARAAPGSPMRARDLAIGQRLARRDRQRDLIDPAVEGAGTGRARSADARGRAPRPPEARRCRRSAPAMKAGGWRLAASGKRRASRLRAASLVALRQLRADDARARRQTSAQRPIAVSNRERCWPCSPCRGRSGPWRPDLSASRAASRREPSQASLTSGCQAQT